MKRRRNGDRIRDTLRDRVINRAKARERETETETDR